MPARYSRAGVKKYSRRLEMIGLSDRFQIFVTSSMAMPSKVNFLRLLVITFYSRLEISSKQGGYRDRGEKQKYFVGAIPDGYVLKKDDLLLAMTEQAAGLLGSPLLVPESSRFLHNQRLGLVLPRQDVAWSNEFFFHIFNLRRIRSEIHASASGVKVRHTSPSKIGAVRVAFPVELKVQKHIAYSLADISEECCRLAAKFECKLAALDELKKSLLHQAFTGQL